MKAVLPCALLAAAAAPAVAQTPPAARPYAALQACRAVADGAARLACFDKAAADLEAAAKTQEVVIVDRQEVKKARKGLFGFTLPRIGFLAGRTGNAEDRADELHLEDTVAQARSTYDGRWRITLSSGAVWDTLEADSRFTDPKPGLQVTLDKAMLGSYFLKVGKGRAIKARRVG